MKPTAAAELRYLVPFVFSESLDPRHIVTVGDQVLSEHLFAFHGRESTRGGFGGVISDIAIDESRATITIKPKHEMRTAGGEALSLADLCHSFKTSLAGTAHSLIAPFVKSVECRPDHFIVAFTKLPVNIRYLFTLADFSIYQPGQLPVSGGTKAATGPYSLVSFSPGEALLERNPSYPGELVANQVPRLRIEGYAASQSKELARKLDPRSAPLVYFYGYSLGAEDLDLLRGKGYSLRLMPSEWLVYMGIKPSVPLPQRRWFASFIDRQRAKLLESTLGQEAYSMSPWDRPFGLTKDVYEGLISRTDAGSAPKGKLTLATLDEWKDLPIFANLLRTLAAEAKEHLEITAVARKDIGKLWDGSFDIVLSPLGISPSDPINNFVFLEELRPFVTEQDLLSVSTENDAPRFNAQLAEFEKKVAASRTWIPVGHFPGVVAEAPNFHRVPELSWAWGVQTWTYEIK